ncbi:MAG: arabinan endo-1,5-alpha-L-arabinosidase [Phycisphaerae bacterium]
MLIVVGVASAQTRSTPLPGVAATAPAVMHARATPADVEFLRQYGNTGVRVHDPSTIIRCGEEYWVFSTGLDTPSFHSKDLLHWERGKPVNTMAHAWVKEAVPSGHDGVYWAPDIIKVRDKYLLFFSASAFGKNTSGIGVMENATLDQNDPGYRWKENGLVIMSKENDDFNTIDPAPILDTDGRLWMSFGSFWSGIKLVELNPETGVRISPESPVYSLAHWDSIEASYIYPHDGYYYLFVSVGLCCRGADSTYHTRVGRATKITGPYLDKEGNDMLLGGGTPFSESDGIFIGPGHAGIIEVGGKYYFSCHFYDGSERGVSNLSVRQLVWG